MPTWMDEQYFLMSIITVATFAFLLARFAFAASPGRDRLRCPEATTETQDATPRRRLPAFD